VIDLLNARIRAVDRPYTLRFYGITEEVFDELVDEDTKAELIDGVMVIRSHPSPLHNDLVNFLDTLLHCYAKENDLGSVFGPDTLVRLKSNWKVTPDVLFFARDRMPSPLPEWQFEIPPDLIIEVLAPFDAPEPLEEKLSAYQEAGVHEIWVVASELQRVVIHRRRRKHYACIPHAAGRAVSQVVPGFWVETAWLWAEPRPKEIPCLGEILGRSPLEGND
jgi:Uma2 family endonuclease